MSTTIKQEGGGRFAKALRDAMAEKGLTIKDVAARIPGREESHASYEHIRKLYNGQCPPSFWVLEKLCAVLNLDFEDMHELSVADKIEMKYGGIPHIMMGQHPELSLLARHWDLLTSEQKEMFKVQIKGVANSNAQARMAS